MIHFAEEVAAVLFLGSLVLLILYGISEVLKDDARKCRERQQIAIWEWARSLTPSERAMWEPIAQSKGVETAWRLATAKGFRAERTRKRIRRLWQP